MEEDGGVRIGVELRMKVWLSEASGRGSGVVTEDLWGVGIIASGGVGARGRTLCK